MLGHLVGHHLLLEKFKYVRVDWVTVDIKVLQMVLILFFMMYFEQFWILDLVFTIMLFK